MTRKTKEPDKQKKSVTVADSEQKKPFDPWSATDQKEAIAESELQGQGQYGLPLRQWLAARRILTAKEAILNGQESLPLMEAVHDCLKYGLSAPSWLTEKFYSSLFLLYSAQENTLDGAFGKPFPKGKHVKSIMNNEILRHSIFFYVSKAVKEGKSINKGFWEEVSTHFTGKDTRHKDMECLYKDCCEEFNRNPIQERAANRRREKKSA